MDTAGPEPPRDAMRQRKLVSSDTTAAGQAVISTYTSTYTNSKTGAAFTDAAPSNPARAGQLNNCGARKSAELSVFSFFFPGFLCLAAFSLMPCIY